MSSGRGRLSTWLTATGALLAAAGLAAWWLQAPAPTSAGTPDAAGSPQPVATATGPILEPVRARWEAGAPRRVVVPSLGINAPVVPIKTTNDTLVPPRDPQRLGWWADGAKPGARQGSALVTGHTVSTGGGALDDLENLRPGERIMVRTERGRVVYAVDKVRIYSKGAVAEHAERLFSQGVPGRLVLITCEDWNGESYLSNVVLTATPR